MRLSEGSGDEHSPSCHLSIPDLPRCASPLDQGLECIDGHENLQAGPIQEQPMHPELPLASIVVALLVLLPLPAQLRARNIALITLLISTSILNIIYVINSLVWAENIRDTAPIWCDIGGSRHGLSMFDR